MARKPTGRWADDPLIEVTADREWIAAVEQRLLDVEGAFTALVRLLDEDAPADGHLSLAQGARVLSVSERALRRYVAEGQVPAKRNGTRLTFTRAALLRASSKGLKSRKPSAKELAARKGKRNA